MAGALKRLVERGVLDAAQVDARLDQILATSPFFRPEFPLTEQLKDLARLVRAKEKGIAGREPADSPESGDEE